MYVLPCSTNNSFRALSLDSTKEHVHGNTNTFDNATLLTFRTIIAVTTMHAGTFASMAKGNLFDSPWRGSYGGSYVAWFVRGVVRTVVCTWCGSYVVWFIRGVVHKWHGSYVAWFVRGMVRTWCGSYVAWFVRGVVCTWCGSYMAWFIRGGVVHMRYHISKSD